MHLYSFVLQFKQVKQMNEIRILLDTTTDEPLVKMFVDDEVYIQLTVKAAIVASVMRIQLEKEHGAIRPLLGFAFEYFECVKKGRLVLFEQRPNAPVGLYVQEADFSKFYEAFNR